MNSVASICSAAKVGLEGAGESFLRNARSLRDLPRPYPSHKRGFLSDCVQQIELRVVLGLVVSGFFFFLLHLSCREMFAESQSDCSLLLFRKLS